MSDPTLDQPMTMAEIRKLADAVERTLANENEIEVRSAENDLAAMCIALRQLCAALELASKFINHGQNVGFPRTYKPDDLIAEAYRREQCPTTPK